MDVESRLRLSIPEQALSEVVTSRCSERCLSALAVVARLEAAYELRRVLVVQCVIRNATVGSRFCATGQHLSPISH